MVSIIATEGVRVIQQMNETIQKLQSENSHLKRELGHSKSKKSPRSPRTPRNDKVMPCYIESKENNDVC